MDIHELTGIEELEKQRIDPYTESIINKKVRLNLSDILHNVPDNSTLFNIFAHECRNQGWTEPEIETVKRNALSADRDHLIKVLSSYCIPNPHYDTPSIEDQLDEVVLDYEDNYDTYDDDYDEFEDYDEYDDDCDWDDVEDNSPCSYCARPDSDCESCPDRG